MIITNFQNQLEDDQVVFTDYRLTLMNYFIH